MKKVLLLFPLVFVCLCWNARGQQPVDPGPWQGAQPVVMAGTQLRVKFDTQVGTAISRVGDGVEVRLIEPVDAEGREVLPVGTTLTGRVLFVRKGDTHKKVVPVLRLAFEQVRLPGGRAFPVKAFIASLGRMVQVDAEGAVIPTQDTKARNIAAAAGTAGVGAGVGAIAEGGSGAAKGAAIGAGIGILGDLLTRNDDYWDFSLNKGRKAWLRLDADLVISGASASEPSSPPAQALEPKPETPAAAPSATPAPANEAAVYLEPTIVMGTRRVNVAGLRQDLSNAGILVVEELSEAVFSLSVWRDSQGFHGELKDRTGSVLWAGSAVTQGGFVRGIARYVGGHRSPQAGSADLRLRGPRC